MNTTALLALSLVAAGCTESAPLAPQAGSFIWVEAESTTSTNFPAVDRHSWAPQNPAEVEVLSGGKWIGADGKRTAPLFAEYTIQVPKDGTYQVYARKFWKHGPYRWRIGTGPWQSVGPEVALLDEGPIRQFVVANWTPAGKATLKAGTHTFRIESTSSEGAIAFDAFVLTTDPFLPRGKMKPGEKYNRAPDGYFPFEPDADRFAPSAIDLRSLNEEFAGQNGFIKPKGEEFIHSGTGKPVRFWATNTGHDALQLDDVSLATFARSLAKQGVNLIRVHGPVMGSDWTKSDPAIVKGTQRFVQAMKKEGIYTCLSIYFPLWFRPNASQLAGYNGNQHPFGIQFFSDPFNRSYRQWWRDLLTTPDPATGKPLTADPAVAMVELVNEDSYFFWTFTPYENVPAAQMEVLEKAFGTWLARKYGTVDTALRTWGGERRRGDDPAAGRAGFRPLWEMANVKDVRSKDTVAFLTEHQRNWFDRSAEFLRKDLGYRGMIQGSNWITADPRVLGPLDKWSNAGLDYLDHHGYFDIGHEGEAASYSIRAGHTFRDLSALTFPGDNFSLPIFDIRYDNKPSTISELNWPNPNRLRADLPLAAAAYGVLQGTDAVFFFANATPSWEGPNAKFGIRTPVIVGQFPATALIYRKGLVKPGPVAVEANLDLKKLLNLEGAPVTAPQNLDQLRAADIPGQPNRVPKLDGIDPLSFLVGKVAMNFTAEERPATTMNLGRYIDRSAKVVRSATGELSWDYGKGLLRVDAPMAQGIAGYLNRGTLSTAAVEIQSPLEYGAIVLVALDDKPLSQSSKMLLQVMSQESNFGFTTSGTDKLTITSLGGPPLAVKRLRGTIQLNRGDASSLRVTALDANGYPREKLPSAPRITLREDVMYYLVEK